MKKLLPLTLLVLLLVITGCKTTPTEEIPKEPGSPAEVDGIPLLIELRTSSTWSDFKILNSDLILFAEITSLIGEPSYFDLGDGTLALEQSQEAADAGDQVGFIASLILDESAASATLEFDLTKDCSNQSTVSIYGVVEDQPRMIYQRELGDSKDCGGVAFNMAMAGRLEAMEKIGSANFGKEEAVFIETEPPTIQDGIELELITRSNFSTLSIVDAELPPFEILALVGEPTDLHHGEVIVIDIHQPDSEAELGKWVGARMRLGIDPENQAQTLDLLFEQGCINETILNFYKVVDGERFPMPNLDYKYSSTIFECTDPIPIQVNLDQPQIPLRHYVLESIHLDEGDLGVEGQVFLEVELVTNSNWAEILSDDKGIISTELLSVSGDPTRVQVRRDTLQVAQPNSAAGSALEVGVTARFGFLPQGEDQKISLLLQNGALNQAAIRFFANQNGKRIPIPLRGDQDSITVYGFEAQDFSLDLDTVQAVIKAAQLYDDIPMVAYLSDIQGEVLVRQPGMEEVYPAREGSPVNVGGEVLTGAYSEVYLTVSDGTVIRLGPNTIFGLETGISSDEITLPRFRLELGEIELVSGSGGFLIYTPESVVGAIGSAALVTVSSEGQVELDCLAGDCFLYDGTAATAEVKERLPGVVAAALEVAEVLLDLSGTAGIDLDGDNDGVPDDLDLCPGDGDHGYGVDAQGCPIQTDSSALSQDWDGDGLLDFEDPCPTVNAISEGSAASEFFDQSIYALYTGCPEGDNNFNGVPDDMECNPDEECTDRDGDGWLDEDDLCPDIYSVGTNVWKVYKENYGCPLDDNDYDGVPDDLECDDCEPPDSDNDGVNDLIDICDNLGDFGNGVDITGCPILPTDSDGDGIPDLIDSCPIEGDLGNGVDTNGCPYLTGSEPTPQDWDGDGYDDSVDRCPTVFAPWRPSPGETDPLGCPVGDNNYDGIPDDE